MMVTRGNISTPCSEQGSGLKTSGGPFQPMFLSNSKRIYEQVYTMFVGQQILFWRASGDSEGNLRATVNNQPQAKPGIDATAKSADVLLSFSTRGLLKESSVNAAFASGIWRCVCFHSLLPQASAFGHCGRQTNIHGVPSPDLAQLLCWHPVQAVLKNGDDSEQIDTNDCRTGNHILRHSKQGT